MKIKLLALLAVIILAVGPIRPVSAAPLLPAAQAVVQQPAQQGGDTTPQQIPLSTILFGIASAVLLIITVTDRVLHQRTVASLTQALKEAKSDEKIIVPLQDLAKDLAKGVVSADLFKQALDIISKGAEFAKVFTPDDVDAAIDEGVGLIGKVISPTDQSVAQ